MSFVYLHQSVTKTKVSQPNLASTAIPLELITPRALGKNVHHASYVNVSQAFVCLFALLLEGIKFS